MTQNPHLVRAAFAYAKERKDQRKAHFHTLEGDLISSFPTPLTAAEGRIVTAPLRNALASYEWAENRYYDIMDDYERIVG